MCLHVLLLDGIMHGGNISLGSSFAVFLFYFPCDMDAAISRCLLAVPRPTMQFKLFTVVGKVFSKAAEKECWRILYNTWGAEAVLSCIAATQHRNYNTPTVCSLVESICVGQKPFCGFLL